MTAIPILESEVITLLPQVYLSSTADFIHFAVENDAILLDEFNPKGFFNN